MSKVLRLEITDNCNLKCKMCWSTDWQHKDMSFEKISKLIYDYNKHEPNGIVVLTSREPLMSKNFIAIVELCNKLGLDLKLLTNATLLNDEYCKFIVNSNVSFVSVSIHGNESEHDNIVSVKGAYKKTINGLNLLNRYRNMFHREDLEIRVTTLISKSLKNSLYEIFELTKNMNLCLRIQHKMFHDGIIKKQNICEIQKKYQYIDECIMGFPDNSDITGNEVIEIIDNAKELADKLNVDLQIYPDLTEKEVFSWYDSINNEFNEMKYCDHSLNSIRVRSNGDIVFCQYVDKIFGNINIESLDDIIYKNSSYINMCEEFVHGNILPICYRCCHCRNKRKILDIHNHKI